MLNTYEDVALSPELSVIMQKVIEIIDGFQKSKVIGISNVYNLFLVALSPELSVIMQKVIEIIDGFQKSKVIGISNVYNLFLNIKGFIPFDQANRQKLEYSTYELFLSTLPGNLMN